jgi:glycosyltransferase involved in cell wall biosynthesis
MPHPQPLAAKSLAFDSDVVRFTAFADLRSSAARKNPLGAIKAFRQAFPEPRGAELTVKLSAPDADAEAVAAIAAAEQGCTDIRVIAEHLDDRDLQRLFDQTDVLVSLHRSEGFGLTIAEAMAAGKAVVATAWSGNLDFMPDIGIQRVRAELVPIEDPSGLYSGQHWAEPDLAAAAAALRTLAIDAELRAHCGELNRAAIARLHLAWDRDVLLAQPIGRFGSFLV